MISPWTVYEPVKTKALIELLTFFPHAFCVWVMYQFVSNDIEFTNRVWIVNVTGLFIMNFHIGFYSTYLLKRAIRLYSDDKRAMMLVNNSISLGYLLGSLLTVGLAEIKNFIRH